MKSLRGAINAMCRQCIYDPNAAGSAAVQVECCTAYDCALWDVRSIRPEHHRVPYSAPVVAELGWTPEKAVWRFENPRSRPGGV